MAFRSAVIADPHLAPDHYFQQLNFSSTVVLPSVTFLSYSIYKRIIIAPIATIMHIGFLFFSFIFLFYLIHCEFTKYSNLGSFVDYFQLLGKIWVFSKWISNILMINVVFRTYLIKNCHRADNTDHFSTFGGTARHVFKSSN